MTAELTRRAFGAGCLWCATSTTASAVVAAHGCRALRVFGADGAPLPDQEFDPRFVIRTTGREELDRALGQALLRMREFFDVVPGVGMYDDANTPNALTFETTFVPNTQGTVVLGLELMRRQLAAHNDSGVSVVAILAHEFGHVLQNQAGVVDRLALPNGGKKLIELHADFFAGLYMANLARTPGIRLIETARTFEGLGDTQFTDPEHHGTPEERVAAIEFGYQVGNADPNLRPRNAIDESIGYVRNTFSR